MSSWRIETGPEFDRAMAELDRPIAQRILDYLDDLLTLDDPANAAAGSPETGQATGGTGSATTACWPR